MAHPTDEPELTLGCDATCAQTLFSKLANYIGSNLVHLVDTPDDVSPLPDLDFLFFFF